MVSVGGSRQRVIPRRATLDLLFGQQSNTRRGIRERVSCDDPNGIVDLIIVVISFRSGVQKLENKFSVKYLHFTVLQAGR